MPKKSAFRFSQMINGRLVSRDGHGNHLEHTSAACETCGRRFEFTARRRALRYCSGTCRRAGRLKQPIGPGGYRRVLTDDGHRPAHHVAMEQKLGRPLLPDERVEHLDGDRFNNAPGNLLLRTRGAARSGALPYSHLSRAQQKRSTERALRERERATP